MGEGVMSSQTDRLERGLVTGPQCTELEGLPEHRTAGQPIHPVANSLTCPARAQPAPRAGVRGKTRDPQNPAPGPGALPRLPVQTLPSLQKCAWASLDGRRCP